MRLVAHVALIGLLATPAFADLVVTTSKHKDAVKMPGMEQPAKDTKEVTWFGKDRMRSEEGERVTIVRADLKKMYMLDTKAKTVSTIDLPLDMKKYMPPEMEQMLAMVGQPKVTVTPTTETKKIKDWNATKYTVSIAMGMGGTSTQDMWVTKDIEMDGPAIRELSGAMMSAMPMVGTSMAAEFKKIDGFTVLTESSHPMMGKSRDEVTSIEKKDPTEGLYEVPKDYTEKPFDPMADMQGAAGRGPGGPPKHQ